MKVFSETSIKNFIPFKPDRWVDTVIASSCLIQTVPIKLYSLSDDAFSMLFGMRNVYMVGQTTQKHIVGSTIHRLLSEISLTEKIDPLSGKATCSCQSLMAEMDRLGPDEVEKRIDEFVGHMLKNAEQYSWLEKAKAGIAAITKYPELAGIFAADGLAGVLRFFVTEAIRIAREGNGKNEKG